MFAAVGVFGSLLGDVGAGDDAGGGEDAADDPVEDEDTGDPGDDVPSDEADTIVIILVKMQVVEQMMVV